MTDRVISIYETLADVPSDFVGLARVGGDTTNYSILINATKVNGVITRDSHGSSDNIADRPSAAALGKGGWQVGSDLYISDGVSYTNISSISSISIKSTIGKTSIAAFIGNSLIEGGELANLVSKNCPSVIGAVRVGVGGNTTQLILNRIATDVPDFVDTAFVLEGTNDATGSVPYATHIANMRLIIQHLQGRGITPVVLLGAPYDGGSRDAVQKNRIGDLLVAREQGVECYDPFLDNIDPILGGWVAADTLDGVHATQATYYDAGVKLGTKLTNRIVASMRPTHNNVFNSMIPTNSLFLTDTNADGLANGNTLTGGDGTTIASLTSGAADGIRGNWQTVTCTAASGAKILFTSNIATGFAVGDIISIRVAYKFTISAGTPTSYLSVKIFMGVNPSVNKNLVKAITVSYDTQLLEYKFAVPAGCSGIQVFSLVDGTNQSSVVQIGELAVYNETTLLPV